MECAEGDNRVVNVCEHARRIVAVLSFIGLCACGGGGSDMVTAPAPQGGSAEPSSGGGPDGAALSIVPRARH